MKIITCIFHYIMQLCMLLLVCIALGSILPSFFGIRPFVILSGSMEPAIPTGSVVYTNQNFSNYDIHTNTIITYRMDDTFVTHRVVEVYPEHVITKGDANQTVDFQPVNYSQITGIILTWIPYLGYLYQGITTPYFLWLLITLIIVDLIISFFHQLTKNKEKEKKQYEKKNTCNSTSNRNSSHSTLRRR